MIGFEAYWVRALWDCGRLSTCWVRLSQVWGVTVTVHTILVVAAMNNQELHHMDVHNAFFHGDLEEEMYTKLPLGYNFQQPGMVFGLQKSLNGLK